MPKKRGGRRGKGSKAADEQPPKPETKSETPPSTSQSLQKSPPSKQIKIETPSEEQIKCGPAKSRPLAPEEVMSGLLITEEQPFKPSRQEEFQPVAQGRGRGELTEQEPRSVWGRGRPIAQGRGRGQAPAQPTRPGPAPEQGWGGAKPKELQPEKFKGEGGGQGRARVQPSKPGATLEQGWGEAISKETSSFKQLEQKRPKQQVLAPEKSGGGAKTVTSSQPLAIKPGTLGRRIKIESNHFDLNLGSLKEAYRYDVSIQPEKKPKRMYIQAMRLFQNVYFPNNYPSYDGQKLLFSAKRLPLQNDFVSGSVTLNIGEGRQQEFEITITLTGTIDLSPLHNLLQKKNIGSEEAAFQCVEVVFRQAYINSFISVGRRFYTPGANAYPLGAGAEMYLGGYQAAVKGWTPFLNVDVAHKGFTTSISVIDLVLDMFSTRYKRVTYQDLRSNLPKWQIDQLTEYLKGLKVIYQIPNHFKKVYKVNGLEGPASEETFELDGKKITVEDFFKTKWHCNLKYPNLATLWVGNDKKKICVPMEYCTLQERQPVDGGRLTSGQTTQMINYSATSTTERKKKIQNVMQTAGHNENPCIQEFGFSLGHDFQRLDGRVLSPPQLIYSDGVVTPKGGVWRGGKFKVGAEILKWTVVGVGVQRERVGKEINDLARKIVDFGSASGMQFSAPIQPFAFIRSDFRSLVEYLEGKKSFDLVVVVIQPNKDAYYLVKQVAELRVGCLTQCVKSSTLNKLSDSTIGNILLKINCKMNGTSHTIRNLDLISMEPCMVMGADVTHPSPQATRIPSVIAVTASHDLTATNYNLSVGLQVPRSTMSEMIQNLQAITVEKLKRFFSNTNKDPTKLFFLRDGVSDGEFQRVKDVEVAAILRACEAYKRGYRPKLTFLVVQKRHHTRFFPTDRDSSGGDKNFNVPPSTCVDTVITDPTILNYYQVSHASIKGVARPTKYCVLYDENDLSSDDVQMLTYYLCHVFSRCNRAVSYPAPTYYAHLAADRAKGYLYGKTVDLNNLNQKLVQIKEAFEAQNPMFFS